MKRFIADYDLALGLLVVTGILLLAGRHDPSSAYRASGLAMGAIALTRLFDTRTRLQDTRAQELSRRRQDLDETRRLAYMALLATEIDRHAEVGASVLNALGHHSRLAAVEETSEQVVLALRGDEHGRQWLRNQIRTISEELGDGS